MAFPVVRTARLLPFALTFGLAAAAPSTVVVALPPAINVNYLLPILPANDYINMNFWGFLQMYKPLIWVDHKVQVDYACSIASSITTPDGQHYFVTMNPKWHWSDGQPVTARDLLFDLKLLRSIQASNASAYGGWSIGGIPNDIASVKRLSRFRVEITYNRPYNAKWVILNGMSQLVPLPAQAWDRYPGHPAKTLAYLQSHGDAAAFFAKSPVDGPFKVLRSRLDHGVLFQANAAYDGHRPDYQRLDLRYFTSSDAEFAALKTGQVQVGYVPFHLYAQRHIPGYRSAFFSSWGITFIELNYKNPATRAFHDPLVRQALQMAIDQPGYIKAFYSSQAIPQYGPVPYQPPTYLSPRLSSGYVPYPYDPAAGKALLIKDGWSLSHGVMTKGKQQLDFTLDYASGSLSNQQVAEAFAEAAAREGVRIHLKPQPFDTIFGNLGSATAWQMAFYGNGWTYLPDFYPSNGGLFGTGGGSNLQGFSDPAIDRLIAKTHAYLPASQSALALSRYQDALARAVPDLWLPEAAGAWTGATGAVTEYSKALHGVRAHLNPTGVISPQYWSLR